MNASSLVHRSSIQTTLTVVVVLATLLIWSASAQSFDGKRKGFVLGAGIGLSYAHRPNVGYLYDDEGKFLGFEAHQNLGVLSDLILAYGINEQVIIGYSGLQFWGTKILKEEDPNESNKAAYAVMPSIAVWYFLKPTIPSAYLKGGIAWGTVPGVHGGFIFFWDHGFTPHLAAGYQWQRALGVELTVYYVDAEGPSEFHGIDPNDSAFPGLLGVGVMIRATAF